MLSKKVLKLLAYSGVRSRHYYHFEGEEVISSHPLPRHVPELAIMRSYENVNKIDVVLSSSEAEDFEMAALTFMDATSWMGLWIFAAKSVSLRISEDSRTEQGGMVSRVMCSLAHEVVQWTDVHSVNLLARCIPGKKNILAD